MAYFITLDIGGTKVAAVRYDAETLKPLGATERVPATRIATQPEFESYLQGLAATLGTQSLRGVGISVAGTCDPNNGVVYKSPNAPWLDKMPIKALIERTLKVPAAVDNDGNLFAYAEAKLGAARGRRHVLGITLGTGVGGGIIIDGAIHQGSGIGSAELGHIPIAFNGPACSCGAFGCIEAYIAGWAIPRTAKTVAEKFSGPMTLRESQFTGEDLYSAATRGDAFAKAFWQRYGEYLGYLLVGVINLIRPEAVVVGGSGVQSLPLFVDATWGVVKARVMPPLFPELKISPAECADAGNLGAALIVKALG